MLRIFSQGVMFSGALASIWPLSSIHHAPPLREVVFITHSILSAHTRDPTSTALGSRAAPFSFLLLFSILSSGGGH